MSRRDFPDCRDYDIDPFTGMGVYRPKNNGNETADNRVRRERPPVYSDASPQRSYGWDYPDHP